MEDGRQLQFTLSDQALPFSLDWRVPKQPEKVVHNIQEEEYPINGVSTQLQLRTDPWEIKKTLNVSDVNHLCRLLIPTNLVNQHILRDLDEESQKQVRTIEGLVFNIWDANTNTNHKLTLKQWVSRSFVFANGWSRDFVRRRNLKAGDEIGLVWHPFRREIMFTVLSRASPPSH